MNLLIKYYDKDSNGGGIPDEDDLLMNEAISFLTFVSNNYTLYSVYDNIALYCSKEDARKPFLAVEVLTRVGMYRIFKEQSM